MSITSKCDVGVKYHTSRVGARLKAEMAIRAHGKSAGYAAFLASHP